MHVNLGPRQVARVRGSYQEEADMAKYVETVVRVAGSYEAALGIIAAETRKLGGSVTEALVRLAQPKHLGEAMKIAEILAGVCAKKEPSPVPIEVQSRIISIDRTKPFDPAHFIGKGWAIWRGPADGDGLSGEEEQDLRSLAITELDLAKTRFETMLAPGETEIKGEEKHKRLKAAGHIRLDAKIFQTLWENKERLPEEWKEKVNGNTRYIFCDGTPLRDPHGERGVLCFYWDGGRWSWDVRWLEYDWGAASPSLVLASSSLDSTPLA